MKHKCLRNNEEADSRGKAPTSAAPGKGGLYLVLEGGYSIIYEQREDYFLVSWFQLGIILWHLAPWTISF